MRPGVIYLTVMLTLVPTFAGCTMKAGAYEPPLTVSPEPFVVDPKFCLDVHSFGGEACRIQPTEC